MERREFMKQALMVGAAGATGIAPAGQPAQERLYELRLYESRSDIDPARLRAFLEDAHLPALRRLGVGPVGAFSPEVGLPGQNTVLLMQHESPAALHGLPGRLAADAAYTEAVRAYESDARLPYVRYEARLLRPFALPALEPPPAPGNGPAHHFELRTYESRSSIALQSKMAMFGAGEVGIFRRLGMLPVFFGENLFATRLPSLSYMLAFPDMAARAQAWRAFSADPEWRALRQDPRFAVEGGNTSTTQALFLNPLPFSELR
ncbi:MAG TPA: NIPSNAP family protein [Longimicrobiales bacterium]